VKGGYEKGKEWQGEKRRKMMDKVRTILSSITDSAMQTYD